MNRTFQIRLSGLDLGQLLDGLRSRSEAWQKTSEYLTAGCVSDKFFLCEECSNSDDAAAIASHYLKIISLIEQQIGDQGGW